MREQDREVGVPPVNELQTLDAIASEHGAILGFRACEETGEFEPVFMRVGRADEGDENSPATLEINDANGMSLGRYLMSRARLDSALAESDVVAETDSPGIVP
jgi:hypothetical protein